MVRDAVRKTNTGEADVGRITNKVIFVFESLRRGIFEGGLVCRGHERDKEVHQDLCISCAYRVRMCADVKGHLC